MPVSLSAFHWHPVRSTKKIASIAARSGTRGLWHPRGWGGRAGSRGCIFAHSASGRRQPSSRTRRPGVLNASFFVMPQIWAASAALPSGIGFKPPRFGLRDHRARSRSASGRDGLIANDKFCLVRRTRLRLSWSRLSLRDRSARGSAASAESLLTGGTDAMPMDRSSDDTAGPGRPTPLGPGLPGGAGLGGGAGRRACRRVARPRRAGGWP